MAAPVRNGWKMLMSTGVRLGMGSCGLCDEESGLILDPDAVQTMPPYAIGLLKGSCWEGNELHGAVHRSPPITSPRLLLTLDFS